MSDLYVLEFIVLPCHSSQCRNDIQNAMPQEDSASTHDIEVGSILNFLDS